MIYAFVLNVPACVTGMLKEVPENIRSLRQVLLIPGAHPNNGRVIRTLQAEIEDCLVVPPPSMFSLAERGEMITQVGLHAALCRELAMVMANHPERTPVGIASPARNVVRAFCGVNEIAERELYPLQIDARAMRAQLVTSN